MQNYGIPIRKPISFKLKDWLNKHHSAIEALLQWLLLSLLVTIPFELQSIVKYMHYYRATVLIISLNIIILTRLVWLNKKEWLTALMLTCGIAIVGNLCYYFYNDTLNGIGSVNGDFLKYAVWVIFVAYLLSSYILHTSTSHRKIIRLLLISLLGFLSIMIISSFCSINPSRSFYYFCRETGLYVLLFLSLGIILNTREKVSRLMLTLTFLGAVIALIVIIEWGVYHYSGEKVRTLMENKNMVYRAPEDTTGLSVRLWFPFRHHNRLGNFLMMSVYFSLLSLSLSGAKSASWQKVFYPICVLLIFVAVLFTLTRGAVIALIISGIFIAVMYRRQLVLLILPLCIVLVLIAPQNVKTQLLTIINPKTYTTSGEHYTSVTARFRLIKFGWQVFKKHPFLGIGYGWKNFEKIYNKEYKEVKNELTGPHTHNNFLEVFVETGALGGLFFVAFTVLLLLALLRKIRFYKSGVSKTSSHHTERYYLIGLLLLGLFIATHLFGMTNYSLRRSIGFLVWTSWALAFAYTMFKWEIDDSTYNNKPLPHS